MVADLANDPDWRPNVLGVALLEGEPGLPGAVYRERIRAGGTDVDSEVEITRRDAAWVGFRIRRPIAGSGGYRVTADEEGCLLAFELDLEPQGGLMALAQGVIAGRVQRAIEEDLARLRGMVGRGEV